MIVLQMHHMIVQKQPTSNQLKLHHIVLKTKANLCFIITYQIISTIDCIYFKKEIHRWHSHTLYIPIYIYNIVCFIHSMCITGRLTILICATFNFVFLFNSSLLISFCFVLFSSNQITYIVNKMSNGWTTEVCMVQFSEGRSLCTSLFFRGNGAFRLLKSEKSNSQKLKSK